jgi:hypothetical protein
MDSTSEPFGFKISPPGEGLQMSRADRWTVYLPHRCDEWVVADAAEWPYLAGQVRQFLHELQRLVAETAREHGFEWSG